MANTQNNKLSRALMAILLELQIIDSPTDTGSGAIVRLRLSTDG